MPRKKVSTGGTAAAVATPPQGRRTRRQTMQMARESMEPTEDGPNSSPSPDELSSEASVMTPIPQEVTALESLAIVSGLPLIRFRHLGWRYASHCYQCNMNTGR